MLMAELRGMLTGLHVAWDAGVKHLILESDSQVAVKLVNEGVPTTHPYYFIVHRISLLLQRHWVVRILHTWREANRVADVLANLSHGVQLGSHIWVDPPPSTLLNLHYDCMGTFVPRLVSV